MKPILKEKKDFSSKLVDSETLQRLIATTDDMLKTIITMSSALLAIGFIFNDFVKSPLVRAVIIILFFIGLVLAFLGMLPFNLRHDVEDAEEMKQQQVKSFLRKRRHLWLSAGVMAIALILAILDLLVDVFKDVG